MIKVAVTNLQAYNDGELIFEWLKIPFTQIEIQKVFEAIGSERYFISDYECEMFHVRINEYDDLNVLNELCEQISELDSFELIELQAISEIYSNSLNEAFEILNNNDFTLYETESMEELAEMLVDEGCFGEIPTAIENYIDYEKIARDLEFDGYTKTSYGIIIFY